MAIQEVDWKEPDRGPKHNLFELQAGRADRIRAAIEQAMGLSPRDPNHWGSLAILARAQIALAEIDAAFAPRSKNRYLSLKKMPKTFSRRAFCFACCGENKCDSNLLTGERLLPILVTGLR